MSSLRGINYVSYNVNLCKSAYFVVA